MLTGRSQASEATDPRRVPASRTVNATNYGTVQLPAKRAGFVSQGNDERDASSKGCLPFE